MAVAFPDSSGSACRIWEPLDKGSGFRLLRRRTRRRTTYIPQIARLINLGHVRSSVACSGLRRHRPMLLVLLDVRRDHPSGLRVTSSLRTDSPRPSRVPLPPRLASAFVPDRRFLQFASRENLSESPGLSGHGGILENR